MRTVTTMVIVILRVNGLIAAPETALAPPVLAILATFVAWFRYSSNVICRVYLHFGIPYGRFVSKAIIARILYMFYFKKHRIDYKKHNISHINLIFHSIISKVISFL